MNIKDSNKYYLGVVGAKKRFVHLATVEDGLRIYMAVWDTVTGKLHLNDYTTGQFEEIEDDNLWKELERLLFERKITTIEQEQPLEEFPWQVKKES
jgi:hypothetical protein